MVHPQLHLHQDMCPRKCRSRMPFETYRLNIKDRQVR